MLFRSASRVPRLLLLPSRPAYRSSLLLFEAASASLAQRPAPSRPLHGRDWEGRSLKRSASFSARPRLPFGLSSISQLLRLLRRLQRLGRWTFLRDFDSCSSPPHVLSAPLQHSLPLPAIPRRIHRLWPVHLPLLLALPPPLRLPRLPHPSSPPPPTPLPSLCGAREPPSSRPAVRPRRLLFLPPPPPPYAARNVREADDCPLVEAYGDLPCGANDRPPRFQRIPLRGSREQPPSQPRAMQSGIPEAVVATGASRCGDEGERGSAGGGFGEGEGGGGDEGCGCWRERVCELGVGGKGRERLRSAVGQGVQARVPLASTSASGIALRSCTSLPRSFPEVENPDPCRRSPLRLSRCQTSSFTFVQKTPASTEIGRAHV